ncbi:MAG: NAD(P)-dependent oxidoreductase, partial [Actinomycetota bacterium]|nr:NAD(P)-dependent oxidoreductase [Actinomycetota bacterium]
MDRVLVTDLIDPAGIALLAQSVEVVQPPDTSLATLRALAREVDAVITRSRLPDDLFEAAPRIRAVMIHGTGTDLVNLAAANARGVMVGNIPGGNAQSVAEYCLMAILLLARNFRAIDKSLRTEAWDTARGLAGHAVEVGGKTLGIVGVGHIGKHLARICGAGLGMRVLGNQRRLNALPEGVEPARVDRLLAESDFVVLTCPLTPETHHLMNAQRIATMKKTAFLVNVGRGPVIDESALVEALRGNAIAGAMLDVYEHYRLEPGHPLLALPNATLTPHLAGSTRESRERSGRIAA